MSLSKGQNPYRFDSFLSQRNAIDYYRDDPFLQTVVKRHAAESWEQVDAAARRLSPTISGRWRDMTDFVGQTEHRPRIVHYDGHNHRIDRIERPDATRTIEREFMSERLLRRDTPAWVRITLLYLAAQNGEASLLCPFGCTEGLVTLLEAFADTPELHRVLEHCTEGIDGEVGVGSQFMSEIQGGADIPSNILTAVKDGDVWRLYGQKFFCSAAHADYAAITAKPLGSEKIGLFVVPAWLHGDKARERRNGHTIDRIKDKMGTRELATAEISYDGAVAYPVGPLDRGVANAVDMVLTRSRLIIGLSSAAFMTRAAREATLYADFREAFGHRIGQMPMVIGQLRKLTGAANRTTAGAYKVYDEFMQLEREVKRGLFSGQAPLDQRVRRFVVRELVMLQKIATASDATEALRLAMSIFGGHGVMEDFLSLPRLFRDAAVNELWEGPRNVLLAQIHRDFQRGLQWCPATTFVGEILKGADPRVIERVAAEMNELLRHPTLLELDEPTIEVCSRWDRFCQELFNMYQELARAELRFETPGPRR